MNFSLLDMPSVSVIIPTYNYANYIIEAINSVLQQDYPKNKIEIIIIDDGSTDNTKQILKDLIHHKIIQYHYQENRGKASATCKAIQRTTGKYIFNLDADDFFLPQKIKQSVEAFETDENIVHVATPAKIFDEKINTIIGNETLPKDILGVSINGQSLLNFFYNNNIFYGSGSTYAARAGVLKQINIPEATDMYIDEFLVLAVLPFGKSFFIPEPLSVWRVHSSNYSGIIKNEAQQKIKSQRLLNASSAILLYLQEHKYNEKLIKIYKLKNSNRLMAYKEFERSKNLTDIINYAKEVFIDIKPGWKLIKKYQVLNRLLPMSLFFLLKKISGKSL